MKSLQVFEHKTIFYGKDHALTKEQFDRLVKYNDRNEQKFFKVVHRGIKFQQYVGVIKVGNLVIEVLPKLDNSEAGEEYGYWQDVLLNMLRVCRLLSPSAPTQADLRLKNHSLLDLYFELFVSEVEYLLHRGLIKRYIDQTENSRAAKGRINFSENIKKNFVHKERFYVTYKKYSYNHLINQLILKTLDVISVVSEDASLKGRIANLRFSLPELDDIRVSGELFKHISFDRKNERYREALQIAELLLLNFSPDIKAGQNNVLALLFDMEQLFEEYVFQRLKKLSVKRSFTVLRQTSRKFWRSKTIRPDIVMKREGKVYVLDTKWKSLSRINPAVNDLRQMFVYNQYFGSERSVLVYPKADEYDQVDELFRQPAELFQADGEPVEHGCMLYFMPLVKEEGLNYRASEELVEAVVG